MGDLALRVMTNDHGFRVIAASTTATARAILALQKVEGAAAKALAELITGVVLLRETMAPDMRVQGVLKGSGGKGTLVGDSFPDGGVRGLAQLRAEPQRSFALGPGSVLQMMRSMAGGVLQQGIVDVGSAGGIGEAITGYLHESEQLVAVARIGVRMEGETVAACGGFIVQLLPEAERGPHLIMTERLEDFPAVESFLERDAFSARVLIDEVLYGMPFTELAANPVRFHCRCDESLVMSALATLDRADIQSMVEEEQPLEINCDYCNKVYAVAVERLRALLATS